MRRTSRPSGLRKPPLTEEQILAWADAHHRLTGRWPTVRGKPARPQAAPTERWHAIDMALRTGLRGLPGGSSLARLFAARRGVRNSQDLPPLEVAVILRWCDDFHRQTGGWPQVNMPRARQPIAGSAGETWRSVHGALVDGTRGLPGGSSLARFLAEHRGVRNVGDLPPLTDRQVLRWADEYHARTGQWPTETCEPQVIPGSGGETWNCIIKAMLKGNRGFRRGTSLARLLTIHRGVRNTQALPPLTEHQVLRWADAFHAATGDWPKGTGTPQEIPGTDGERWCNIDQALVKGLRGLPGGSSLAQLLGRYRGVRNSNLLPGLTLQQVLGWADAYRAATGIWPTVRCSPQLIPGSGGERWRNIDNALRYGLRGFPGGSSLSQMLAEHRGC